MTWPFQISDNPPRCLADFKLGNVTKHRERTFRITLWLRLDKRADLRAQTYFPGNTTKSNSSISNREFFNSEELKWNALMSQSSWASRAREKEMLQIQFGFGFLMKIFFLLFNVSIVMRRVASFISIETWNPSFDISSFHSNHFY